MRIASTRDLSFHSSSDCSVDFVDEHELHHYNQSTPILTVKKDREKFFSKEPLSSNVNKIDNAITRNKTRTYLHSDPLSNTNAEINVSPCLEEHQLRTQQQDNAVTSRRQFDSHLHKQEWEERECEEERVAITNISPLVHLITPSSESVSGYSTEVNEHNAINTKRILTKPISIPLSTPSSRPSPPLTPSSLLPPLPQKQPPLKSNYKMKLSSSPTQVVNNANVNNVELLPKLNEVELEDYLRNSKEDKEFYMSKKDNMEGNVIECNDDVSSLPTRWLNIAGNVANYGLATIERYLDHVLFNDKNNISQSEHYNHKDANKENNVVTPHSKSVSNEGKHTEPNYNYNNINNGNFNVANKANMSETEANVNTEIYETPIRVNLQDNDYIRQNNKFNTSRNIETYSKEEEQKELTSSISSGFAGIFDNSLQSSMYIANTYNENNNDCKTLDNRTVPHNSRESKIRVEHKDVVNAHSNPLPEFSEKRDEQRLEHNHHVKKNNVDREGSDDGNNNNNNKNNNINDASFNRDDIADDNNDDDNVDDEERFPRVMEVYSHNKQFGNELPLGVQKIVLSESQLARIEHRHTSANTIAKNVVANHHNSMKNNNNSLNLNCISTNTEETNWKNAYGFDNNVVNNNIVIDNNNSNTIKHIETFKNNNNNNINNNNNNYLVDNSLYDEDKRNRNQEGSRECSENVSESEYPSVEVDLISGLRGYREYPNEWYGHLVAAALNTRSLPDNPVTAAELAEAEHNPFLVRLIVQSNALNTDDCEIRRNIQETVNALIQMHKDGADPALYEYLVDFMQIDFIRLTHKQSNQLKSNGFEYIKLMYDNKHVLSSGNANSIFFNYSLIVLIINFVVALIDLLAIVLCTIVIGLSIAKWMQPRENNSKESYGFYTLLVFGCGYAARLIINLFIIKRKPDESVYERAGNVSLPSPYLYAVPVLPLFEVMCLVTFVQALHGNYVILAHNSLVASRLASVSFAVAYGFPQLITHSFLQSNIGPDERESKWKYVFTFLIVTVFVQWALALLRFAWMTLAYASTTGLGFARFNIRHSRRPFRCIYLLLHILHLVTVFLIESDIYLIIACNIKFGRAEHDCTFLPVTITVLASIQVIFFLALYSWLVFFDRSSFLISLIDSFLLASHIGVFSLSFDPVGERCTVFRNQIYHRYYTFGYGSLLVYSFVSICIILSILLHFTIKLLQCKCHKHDECSAQVTINEHTVYLADSGNVEEIPKKESFPLYCSTYNNINNTILQGEIAAEHTHVQNSRTCTAPETNMTIAAPMVATMQSSTPSTFTNSNSSSIDLSSHEPFDATSYPLAASSSTPPLTRESISSSSFSSELETKTRSLVRQ